MTNVNSAQLCTVCNINHGKFRCSKCLSGRYCSKECQYVDFNLHRDICNYISQLESIEQEKKFKSFNCSFKTPTSEKDRMKLIKLVGRRPLIKFTLNSKEFQGLFDSGSMISLVSKSWLDFEFPDTKIHPVEKFTGKINGLSLRAANNSIVDVEGIVLFDFKIPNTNITFTAPFIVSKTQTSGPLIGYNIIEYLINCETEQSYKAIESIFPDLNPENSVAVVNLVKGCFVKVIFTVQLE